MDKRFSKGRVIPKIVCVLLSFCLWIYVSNVETIIRTYTLKNVPVKLLNVESVRNYGLALAPNQNFTVNLNLEGDSKFIYSVKPSEFSVIADLSEYALKDGVNNIPVQILNYPSQINVKNNGYLYVKVKLEKYISKDFESTSQVRITYAQNVYKEAIGFTPEKIEVSGPQSAVNQVQTVALVGSLENVAGDVEREFKYEPLDANGNVVEDVSLNVTTGNISVKTNKGKKVPISAEFTGSLPKGISLGSATLSSNYVQIIGSREQLNAISSLKTEPINLSNITGNTTKKVNIVFPEGIKAINGVNNVTVSLDVTGSTEKPPVTNETKPDSSNNNGTNTDNDTTSNNNSGATSENGNTNNKIQKTLSIPLEYSNLKNGLDITTKPSSVNIVVTGDSKSINSISASDFKGNVDLSDITKSGSFNITPNVTLTNENANVAIQSIGKITVVAEDSKKDETKPAVATQKK